MLRLCKKCCIEKELNEENFYFYRDTGTPRQCKECVRKTVTLYQKNNPMKYKKEYKRVLTVRDCFLDKTKIIKS